MKSGLLVSHVGMASQLDALLELGRSKERCRFGKLPEKGYNISF